MARPATVLAGYRASHAALFSTYHSCKVDLVCVSPCYIRYDRRSPFQMTQNLNFHVFASGDTAIVVEFDNRIERALSKQILGAAAALRQAGITGIVEIVPSFRSLLVHYDPIVTTAEKLGDLLTPILQTASDPDLNARRWTIPVCYKGDRAPDLDDVARRTGLSPQEVVELHCETVFHVYMLGFLPGCPYLGDLPNSLRLPRRKTPRVSLPAGSVAIATTLTTIYPIESPGGWHLIGATPVRLFDKNAAAPALFSPGDQVVFTAISSAEFESVAAMVSAGSYSAVCESIGS